MYKLYKEHWWLIKGVTNMHETEIVDFETIEKAQEEMKYAYEMLSSGNCTSLLLKMSFIIIRYDKNGFTDRITQYGILKDIQETGVRE